MIALGEGQGFCPLCGAVLPIEEASQIEVDMEADHKSCIGCGRTFFEARREEGL